MLGISGGSSHLSAHACTWKTMVSVAGDFCKPTMALDIQVTILLTASAIQLSGTSRFSFWASNFSF